MRLFYAIRSFTHDSFMFTCDSFTLHSLCVHKSYTFICLVNQFDTIPLFPYGIFFFQFFRLFYLIHRFMVTSLTLPIIDLRSHVTIFHTFILIFQTNDSSTCFGACDCSLHLIHPFSHAPFYSLIIERFFHTYFIWSFFNLTLSSMIRSPEFKIPLLNKIFIHATCVKFQERSRSQNRSRAVRQPGRARWSLCVCARASVCQSRLWWGSPDFQWSFSSRGAGTGLKARSWRVTQRIRMIYASRGPVSSLYYTAFIGE